MTETTARTPRRIAWWRRPFTAEPWLRTAYVVLAAPLAAIALVDGGRLQQSSVRRLLGREVRATRLRGLLGLPLDLAALVIAGYGWSLVVLNLGYGLRPLVGLDGDYADAWGGPTLAGAWAVHALGGLVMLFAMPWILKGLTTPHVRVLGR